MALDMPAPSGPSSTPMSTPAPSTIITTLIMSGATELITCRWVFWLG